MNVGLVNFRWISGHVHKWRWVLFFFFFVNLQLYVQVVCGFCWFLFDYGCCVCQFLLDFWLRCKFWCGTLLVSVDIVLILPIRCSEFEYALLVYYIQLKQTWWTELCVKKKREGKWHLQATIVKASMYVKICDQQECLVNFNMVSVICISWFPCQTNKCPSNRASFCRNPWKRAHGSRDFMFSHTS